MGGLQQRKSMMTKTSMCLCFAKSSALVNPKTLKGTRLLFRMQKESATSRKRTKVMLSDELRRDVRYGMCPLRSYKTSWPRNQDQRVSHSSTTQEPWMHSSGHSLVVPAENFCLSMVFYDLNLVLVASENRHLNLELSVLLSVEQK